MYKRVKAGAVPKPVQLELGSVAWDQAEVTAWQQSLAHGSKVSAV
jgi:predicted DNA-binding transcriptional regulator AlpA